MSKGRSFTCVQMLHAHAHTHLLTYFSTHPPLITATEVVSLVWGLRAFSLLGRFLRLQKGGRDAYLPILFGMIPTTKIENHQPDYVFFPNEPQVFVGENPSLAFIQILREANIELPVRTNQWGHSEEVHRKFFIFTIVVIA